ncbi:MAG: hypothetical protein KKF74_02225 [Nanoarchaeota archaeon]|nr:hypothetical protein [Nanoarchaeota archaeon]
MVSQALEQMLEFAPRMGQTRMYETIDVYAVGTTALYCRHNPLTTESQCNFCNYEYMKESREQFKPASTFGIGPGIAKESFGFVERYRAGKHENFGKDHLNLDYISPVSKKILENIHIDMQD